MYVMSRAKDRLQFVLDRAQILAEEFGPQTLRELTIDFGCFLNIFIDYLKDELERSDDIQGPDIRSYFKETKATEM